MTAEEVSLHCRLEEAKDSAKIVEIEREIGTERGIAETTEIRNGGPRGSGSPQLEAIEIIGSEEQVQMTSKCRGSPAVQEVVVLLVRKTRGEESKHCRTNFHVTDYLLVPRVVFTP
jgi:hypothetical protein